MTLRLMLGGIKSYLPIRPSSFLGTGGSIDGRYCYGVWLRHLVLLQQAVPGFRPEKVAEIGPGDSIGLGLAALLAGAESYYGLDVLPHASMQANVKALEDLLPLFRSNAPIPDEQQYPDLYPRLQDYSFPSRLLEPRVLADRLEDGLVESLREQVTSGNFRKGQIEYLCPWEASSIPRESVDLVVTQVALQDMDHTVERDDLDRNLAIMAQWLRPGGVMSHQIDMSCPGGQPWNHHWGYGDLKWKLIRGHRPYYQNRAPLSAYFGILKQLGFEVVLVTGVHAPGLPRSRLAAGFRDLPDEDLSTRAAHIVAVKKSTESDGSGSPPRNA